MGACDNTLIMHSGDGCTVRTVLGNYTAFTPQMDPHRKVLDNNMDTKMTARKWESHRSLADTWVV